MLLDTVQRWMQDVIVDPGDDDDVYRENADRAAAYVKPSATLTPYERVNVYRSMYLMRMEEALEADFSALQRFLGHHDFHRLVYDYVQAHPSTSPNLNFLSDHVPTFVAKWSGTRRNAFVTDLARLELTVAQVFHLPTTDALTRDALDAVAPDAWDSVRLEPVATLRLMQFDYPVNAYMQAVMDNDDELPSTARRRTWLAVFKRGFGMVRLTLSGKQHDVLSALVGGATMYEAFLKGTSGRGRVDPPTVVAWMSDWVADGMFAAIK